MKNRTLAKIIFFICMLLCLLVSIPSAVALIIGATIAMTFGNPYARQSSMMTSQLLKVAVIGLGAGMNLLVVGQVGIQGIGYTVFSIVGALSVGYFLGKFLKIPDSISILIGVGTAICGGSAIAATAPVIRAKHSEISVALGTVFLLNSVALIVFPVIGHFFSLSEGQFGLWCALAIHDTSSVVGATLQYGSHALEVGTTVKLTRALWIVPVAFLIGLFFNRKQQSKSVGTPSNKPWFILGFLVAAGLVTWIPELREAGHTIEMVAKRLMVLTLFLIGTCLSRENLRSVGPGPFLQGLILWVLVAGASLGALLMGWINI